VPQSLEYPNFYFMSKFYNLVGAKYGKLTVLSFSHVRDIYGGKSKMWNCICECGGTTVQSTSELNYGRTKSCGCLKAEVTKKRSTTHGQASGGKFTAEYRTWQNMLTRCYNPKATRFEHHGGRGIKVCDRWKNSFEAFFEDVGRKPTTAHTLDRYPDNDGNYEPSNFRWATQKQQSQNRRSTRLIEYNGVTKPLIEWTRFLGLSDSSILSWYIKKHGVEKAMLHYANRK